MEKYFYADGYNKALDDVATLIRTSDVSIDELLDILEISKINFNDVDVEFWALSDNEIRWMLNIFFRGDNRNNLVLVGENDNLVVECLNGGFEFVHDKTDGSNWFNQKTLAKMFGVTQQSVSNKLKTYLNLVGGSNDQYKKNSIALIRLKIENADKPVNFYNFKAVSYLAHRFNTVEALNMLEWIDSSLNTMFNVATGKTDIDTKLDKLKNMYEVEEFKSNEYLQAYKHLIKFDEELANKTYNKYKISKNNAFNCHELLMANRDWNKRYDEVRDTIEPKKYDGSKQLLF